MSGLADMLKAANAYWCSSADAPLAVSVNIWTSTQDPTEDDPTTIYGRRFDTQSGMLEYDDEGGRRDREVFVHVSSDADNGGIASVDQNGWLEVGGVLYSIYEVSSDQFGLFAIRGLRLDVETDDRGHWRSRRG